MDFYTYVLANKPRGTLYIGVTRDIEKRVYQHKTKVIKGFTSQYNLTMLVHFEIFGTPSDAIAREKQLKHWNNTNSKNTGCVGTGFARRGRMFSRLSPYKWHGHILF